MKTLTRNGIEYQAEIIIKGNDYIQGLNLEGVSLFKFSGISNFDIFTLAQGEDWDLPIPEVLLDARKVSFEPSGGLVSKNVHEALEEVFLVSSEIIKTVAHSLGYPFEATDGNTAVKEKLLNMKNHFVEVLINHDIEALNSDTIHELIVKIESIRSQALKHTEYTDVVAPFVLSVDLTNRLNIEDTTATLFNYVIGEIDKTLYFCEFLPEDAVEFMVNANVEFVGKLRLKRDFIKRMVLDSSPILDGRKRNIYAFNPISNGVAKLDDFKIQDSKILGVDWHYLEMTSTTTPAPTQVIMSGTLNSTYADWHCFNGKVDNKWWSPPIYRITDEWIGVDYGSVKMFDHVMITSGDYTVLNRSPKNFEIQAYNADNDTWDTLGSYSTPPWNQAESRVFKFSSVGYSTKYRVFVKNNHGEANYIMIGKIIFGKARD